MASETGAGSLRTVVTMAYDDEVAFRAGWV
jgi:hypothetical protein